MLSVMIRSVVLNVLGVLLVSISPMMLGHYAA
jgi:hypothetical protein